MNAPNHKARKEKGDTMLHNDEESLLSAFASDTQLVELADQDDLGYFVTAGTIFHW